MRHFALCLIGIAGSVYLGGTPVWAHGDEPKAKPSQQSARSVEAAAVEATLQDYARAMSGADLAKVRPIIVGDNEFTYVEGTHVNQGWQSYYDHMAPEMKLFREPKFTIVDVRPFVSGDLAYALFNWTMNVTVVSDQFPDGKHAVSMSGLGTAALSRIGDKWKLRQLHTVQAPRKEAAAPH
jgi:ketosteroid isomerase-like protein